MSVSEHLILPSIRAEAGRLLAPVELDSAGDSATRGELEERRERILDMYEAGHLDRAERERRLAAVGAAFEQLDMRRIVQAVPPVGDIDWDNSRKANAVLRALFEGIELDPATFQPHRYRWAVPEWRA